MVTYYATPDPTLLLSSDGIIVTRAPGLGVRDPTRNELPEVVAAAFGRVIDLVDRASVGNATPQLLKSEHDLSERVRKVFEKVPVAGEYYEFLFAVTDLMGWSATRDPLLDQVKAMDQLLHAYFMQIDKQIFASWSATRLAMLANVQALASSARETIRSIFQNKEDLEAQLTVARLALADQNSLLAVNTFTASVESGYWLRPYSGSAVDLDSWGAKFDDRAPQYGDGTVWDPRLALPTLLYALAVRLVVLRTLHSERRKYCHEVKQHVDFLLGVQMHWQTGIRRKLKLSTPELKIGAGFSVRPFAAGAVDVFTGQQDLIDVDAMALNLYFARGFWAGPLPLHVAPIPPELVSPSITDADIDTRFETEYKAILEKQSAVAFTRLRWSTGLHAFSDTIKSLGMICAGPDAPEMVSVYRDWLPLVRESGGGIKPAAAGDEAQERVELARALARVVQPRGERADGRAMADRYALYCAVKDEDAPLVSELRELVARHISRPRPWRAQREGRREEKDVERT